MQIRNYGVVGLLAFSLTVSCHAAKLEAQRTEWQWPTATMEEQGVDRVAIEGLIAAIEAGHYGLIDDFLIIRHGKLILDEHFDHDYEALSAPHEPVDQQYDYDHPDWHPYYRGTALHTLQSVTKSITSICIGIAIDEGRIPGGVATPAMSFFESYAPDMSDPRRRAMTIEDLLTMQSGIDWNEMISYDDESNSCLQLESSDTWIQYVIDQPMREEPGTRFDYNSGASVLLGKIVREATGQRIDDYAREKLFEPLGISEFKWKTTPDGEIDTEGGLYLSAHDLARIATLFLNLGEWNGERIVSEDWVRASVALHVPDIRPDEPRDNRAYGYQWWIPEHANGIAIQYEGSGYGGQFPIVVPERDLVIVFTGWNIHERPERQTWHAVQDIILPAVRN